MTTRFRSGLRIRRHARVFVAIGYLIAGLLVSLATTHASAQSETSFPDVLTSSDMMATLDRIGLDAEARARAIEAFDSYVTESLALRKSGVERYVARRAAAYGRERPIDVVAQDVAEREHLLGRIAALDQKLYEAIEELAGDAHRAARRERLRAERRHAWSVAGSFQQRQSHMELTTLVDDAWKAEGRRPSDEEARAMDDILASFEEVVTPLYRTLQERAVREPLDLAEARRAANLLRPDARAGATPTEEDWNAYFQQANAIRSDVRAPQYAQRKAIRQQLVSGLERVCAVMPPEVSQRVIDQFVSRIAPEVAQERDPVAPLVTRIRELAASQAISNDVLAEIDSISRSHREQRNRLSIQAAVDADDDRENAESIIAPAAVIGDTASGDRLRRLLKERAECDDRAVAAIRAVVPTLALTEQDASSTSSNGETSVDEALDAQTSETMQYWIADGEDTPVLFEASIDLGSTSRGIAPLDRAWVASIASQYEWSEADVSIVTLLVEDYQQQFQSLREGDFAEWLSLLAIDIFQSDSEPHALRPRDDAEAIAAKRSDLAQRVAQSITALDAAFFESMRAALGERVTPRDALHIQAVRERSVYRGGFDQQAAGAMMLTATGASHASQAELLDVVRSANLDEASLRLLAPRLDRWSTESTALVRNRFVTALRSTQLFDQLNASLLRASPDGSVTVSADDVMAKEAQTAAHVALDANEAVAKHTALAMEEMLALLTDEGVKQRLRVAWWRTIWPGVFVDRTDLRSILANAIALEAIDETRRSELATLRREHEASYDRITTEMVQAHESTEPTTRSFDVAKLRTRQEAMKRLSFERSELNARSMRRLEEILTEEELQTLLPLKRAPVR